MKKEKMKKEKMKIAVVASEVVPWTQSGGLGDISNEISKAFKELGHKVIIITPFYKHAFDPEQHGLKKIKENVTIIIDDNHKEKVNFWRGKHADGLPIYFIENKTFFNQTKNIHYGTTDIYKSDKKNARFLIFNLAVLKLLTKIKFEADIVHCNDWHTGLIPYFLKHDFKTSITLKNTITVFTIHNLVFQMGENWWEIPRDKWDDGKSPLPDFDSPTIENINFAKRAILNADVINTVSEKYAQEILTPENGQELQQLLKKKRKKLFGIVNGIDYKAYNPENDPGLFKNFNWRTVENKKANKKFIQKYYNLPTKENTPIICMASRIAEQKGFDLIRDIGDIVFRFNVQMIFMGNGDPKMIADLKKIQKDHPDKLVVTPFDRKMETSLYAGSDFVLIPARFEPCGVTQMKGMRYGAIPIARYVGGYVDTVSDYNPQTKQGNGIVFTIYDSRALIVAIARALELFKRKSEITRLTKKVMKESFSWHLPAQKYIKLFNKFTKQDE